jgi:hypothetical protein
MLDTIFIKLDLLKFYLEILHFICKWNILVCYAIRI